jgi:hypothetical protein
MEELANRLYLDKEDVILAKTIGLLHDLGRFEQLKLYNSFDDDLYDHANCACDYLFKNNHIRDFIKDDKYDSIINEAIFNHSKISIRDGLNDRELLFSKMIRDMDKLDIYFQVGYEYNQEFKEKPTKRVLDDFYDGKSIEYSLKSNKSDSVITMLAFLNDINFKETFEMLEETDNLGFYLSCVDVSDEYEKEFNSLVKKCYEIIDGELR